LLYERSFWFYFFFSRGGGGFCRKLLVFQNKHGEHTPTFTNEHLVWYTRGGCGTGCYGRSESWWCLRGNIVRRSGCCQGCVRIGILVGWETWTEGIHQQNHNLVLWQVIVRANSTMQGRGLFITERGNEIDRQHLPISIAVCNTIMKHMNRKRQNPMSINILL
jgi:hypothetical protein